MRPKWSPPITTSARQRSGDDSGKHASVVIRPAQRVIVGPGAVQQRVIVRPVPPAVVEKVKRPAWDEKEWVRSVQDGRAVYVGEFRVLQRGRPRRFAGRIVKGPTYLEAYIADPPAEIKKHPKGPCFALVESPWFRVHWQQAPDDPDNAILYVETVLTESLNR